MEDPAELGWAGLELPPGPRFAILGVCLVSFSLIGGPPDGVPGNLRRLLSFPEEVSSSFKARTASLGELIDAEEAAASRAMASATSLSLGTFEEVLVVRRSFLNQH